MRTKDELFFALLNVISDMLVECMLDNREQSFSDEQLKKIDQIESEYLVQYYDVDPI